MSRWCSPPFSGPYTLHVPFSNTSCLRQPSNHSFMFWQRIKWGRPQSVDGSFCLLSTWKLGRGQIVTGRQRQNAHCTFGVVDSRGWETYISKTGRWCSTSSPFNWGTLLKIATSRCCSHIDHKHIRFGLWHVTLFVLTLWFTFMHSGHCFHLCSVCVIVLFFCRGLRMWDSLSCTLCVLFLLLWVLRMWVNMKILLLLANIRHC